MATDFASRSEVSPSIKIFTVFANAAKDYSVFIFRVSQSGLLELLSLRCLAESVTVSVDTA